ncbi:hypothetical protein NT017_40040 [Prolixibacter sp. NT017]|nr:hypothetical protein NT017_40040 [Prolixibacter sp. NT017]
MKDEGTYSGGKKRDSRVNSYEKWNQYGGTKSDKKELNPQYSPFPAS